MVIPQAHALPRPLWFYLKSKLSQGWFHSWPKLLDILMAICYRGWHHAVGRVGVFFANPASCPLLNFQGIREVRLFLSLRLSQGLRVIWKEIQLQERERSLPPGEAILRPIGSRPASESIIGFLVGLTPGPLPWVRPVCSEVRLLNIHFPQRSVQLLKVLGRGK